MLISEIKRLLNNPDLLKEDYEDSLYEYFELYDELLRKTIGEIINANPSEVQKFPSPLKSERLIKIWQDYSTTGVIRDSRYLQDIKSDFILKITQLDVNNYLCGRNQYYPEEEFDDYIEYRNIDMTLDEFKEKSGDYIDQNITDFAMPHFQKILKDVYNSTTDEELLLCLDRILNVIHQRFDLAKMFVVGGRGMLDQLANE